MLDFRYHALSLVAVFLALAIGIVLGVTIGDSLVSDAERALRGNLRADVEKAHGDAANALAQLAARDRMLDQLYPQLVQSRLTGERVALIQILYIGGYETTSHMIGNGIVARLQLRLRVVGLVHHEQVVAAREHDRGRPTDAGAASGDKDDLARHRYDRRRPRGSRPGRAGPELPARDVR